MNDAFLSEEDLDLRRLPWPERVAWWNRWLRLAQATNDRDADRYSHGVFASDPELPQPLPAGASRSSIT